MLRLCWVTNLPGSPSRAVVILESLNVLFVKMHDAGGTVFVFIHHWLIAATDPTSAWNGKSVIALSRRNRRSRRELPNAVRGDIFHRDILLWRRVGHNQRYTWPALLSVVRLTSVTCERFLIRCSAVFYRATSDSDRRMFVFECVRKIVYTWILLFLCWK